MNPQKSIVFTVINDLRSDQRMDKICTSLSSLGYTVTLIGRKLPDSPKLSNKPYQQIRLNCWFQKGKLFYLEYNLRLLFRHYRHRYDIYSAVDMDTLWAACKGAQKWKSKCVLDAHEYFSEVPEVIERPLVRKFWQYWEKKWIPHTHLAYTVNQSLADIFTIAYKKSFQVIRNVPRSKELNTIPAKEKFILYQGALNKGRGLEGLIEAMPDIPCQLKIAGEGVLLSQLKQMVSDRHLDHKVEFLGFVPPSELSILTQTAYIGYNVSENIGLSYYYSLNNKFFDYIQAGLPALTNDFPEYKRHLEQFETGILIVAPTKEFLIPAFKRLLDDEGYYHALKSNCLKAAQVWNWENEEKILDKMYLEILS